MIVLDAYCGKGGWSKPFIEDQDSVWGIDIIDYKYKGILIKQDIRKISSEIISSLFRNNVDLLIGSPPCDQFSIGKEVQIARGNTTRDVSKGLELVREFHRLVEVLKPKVWLMENVSRLEKDWNDPRIVWRFKVSVRGYRTLWGNIPIPNKSINMDYRNLRYGYQSAADRSEIPYEISRYIADTVREYLVKHYGLNYAKVVN